ncbi:MAG: type II toxin-antitoxin system YoeB family toxin [Bacteroidaceae bacterium]|nr:type II toxin-antitoxin system YoeB family toxin [Bacteroidaceae bacterium]
MIYLQFGIKRDRSGLWSRRITRKHRLIDGYY